MKQRIYDSMKGIEIILFLGRQNHVIPGDISPSRDPIAIVSYHSFYLRILVI